MKDENGWGSYEQYYNCGNKDYNVIIDGRNFFDQTMKNDERTYGNIRKISTG